MQQQSHVKSKWIEKTFITVKNSKKWSAQSNYHNCSKKWNSLVMYPEEAVGMANSVDIDKIAV